MYLTRFYKWHNSLQKKQFLANWVANEKFIGHSTVGVMQWNSFLLCTSAVTAVSFYTPTQFYYEQFWETVERRRGIAFRVTACSDVHIVLSNRIRWWGDQYDVVLGIWTNTKYARDPSPLSSPLPFTLWRNVESVKEFIPTLKEFACLLF